MASDAESEEGAEQAKPARRKPKGGDPHVRPEKELKLSVLSGSTSLPKWSFGSAPRFRHTTALARSRTSPTSIGSSVSTRADDNLCRMASTDGFSNHGSRMLQSMSSYDNTFSLCNSRKAPRLEGSLDRASEPRPRVGEPPAKAYGPAETIGESTALTFPHSPHYSFGGGRSRCHDQEKEKRRAELIGTTQLPKKPGSRSATEGLVVKQPAKLCRGFGTAVRLRHRGSAFELPISPGPAAYELPRECDAAPQWGSQSLLPWGKRTGGRPHMRNATATDAGPGGYTEDHPFQAAAPSPTIGLRTTERGAFNADFPDPGSYDVPTLMGEGPAFSLAGARPRERIQDGPGPIYDPRMESVCPHSPGAVFGTVERRHESEEVDPDEPPGPGSYQVSRLYRAGDKPSTAMSRAPRAGAAGMGPANVPGPGTYSLPHTRDLRGIAMAGALYGKVEEGPGPGQYEPKDHLTRHASPSYRPLCQTAARKGAFNTGSSRTEKASEAMLRECAMEVARSAEAMGYGARARDEALAFKPTGPKFSMGARRPEYAPKSAQHNAGFTAQVSSVC